MRDLSSGQIKKAVRSIGFGGERRDLGQAAMA
jgi:hypothetical protein